MNRTLELLLRFHFYIMMAGFFLAVTGLLFYMKYRFHASVPRTIALYVTIGGLVLYFIGRILGVFHRRATRRAKTDESTAG